MSLKENTRHHYVPQCYLKQFAAPRDSGIYLYDKCLSKEYYTPIDKICCANDFYTLDQQFSNGDPEFDPKAVEKDFFASYIEVEYSKMLADIQSFLIQWKEYNQQFPELLRSKLATYLVIQFLRLPDARKYMKKINDEILGELVPLFKKVMSITTGNILFEDLNIVAKYDPNRVDYKYGFGNSDLVNRLAEALYDNIWIFSYSNNNSFFTNDNPVIIIKHKKGVRQINMGLTQEGAEVVFPISKNLSVIIYDRDNCPDLASLDSNIIPVNEKMLFHINSSVYLYSHRYLFTYNRDFGLVEKWLEFLNGKHEFRTSFNEY